MAYRIVQKEDFQGKTIYLAQYSKKLLWKEFWFSFQEDRNGDLYDKEFSSVEEAESYIRLCSQVANYAKQKSQWQIVRSYGNKV